MGKKPVLGLVGAFLAGMALTGCESTRQKTFTPPIARSGQVASRPGASGQTPVAPDYARTTPGGSPGLNNPVGLPGGGSPGGLPTGGGVSPAGGLNQPSIPNNTQRPANVSFNMNNPAPPPPSSPAPLGGSVSSGISPNPNQSQSGGSPSGFTVPPGPNDPFASGAQQPGSMAPLQPAPVVPNAATIGLTPASRPNVQTNPYPETTSPSPGVPPLPSPPGQGPGTMQP